MLRRVDSVHETFRCASFLFPDQICFLTDRDRKSGARKGERPPTRENIMRALLWLVDSSRAGDIMFFAFSGLGTQVPSACERVTGPCGRPGGVSVACAVDIMFFFFALSVDVMFLFFASSVDVMFFAVSVDIMHL